MGIDEAEKAVLRVIDAHMTALDVHGKNAYDDMIDYADKAEKDAADAIAAENPVETGDDDDATENTVSQEPAKEGEDKSRVEQAMSLVEAMTDDEMAIFEGWLANRRETAIVMASPDKRVPAAELRKAA